MENFFIPDENEVIENFKKSNPTTEDYYEIISESDQQFLRKDNQIAKSAINDDDIEIQNYIQSVKAKEAIVRERYNTELPDGYKEIELYDESKSFEENFVLGTDEKYILTKVSKKDGSFMIGTPYYFLPSSLSKCTIDIQKVEKYGSLEFIPVNYDALFSINLLPFINYNSNFFLADERIIFEALLVKFKSFDFKPFYWSKEKILDEVGIKKDRSTKILEKFLNLEIISKELKKSIINNRPMQINYYNLNADKIIELLPKIYKEYEDNSLGNKITNYLMPALSKRRDISRIMQ